MKIFRNPQDKPAKSKKSSLVKEITLYQIPADEDGYVDLDLMKLNNLGYFVRFEDMEPVFGTHKYVAPGNEENILDECFDYFNKVDDGFGLLNYDMSVGDVITIGDDRYRCLPHGWEKF